jgi:hypothetical protein
MKHIFLIFFLICTLPICVAQIGGQTSVRGTVLEEGTYNPFPNANVEVVGGAYTTTNAAGEFRLQARIGEELVIRHEDFETVYHTIGRNDNIKLTVAPNKTKVKAVKRSKQVSQERFQLYLDSAKATLKKDAKVSIEYVAKALATDQEQALLKPQKAKAYELLGDIYTFWKQYDLAVSNYKFSVRDEMTTQRQLKLANAYMLNKSYQESIALYNTLKDKSLSNYNEVLRLEGFGDTYKNTGNLNKAITQYQQALTLAEKHLFTPKVTDLNSKIAEAYDAKGATKPAEDYYENSLNLANKETRKRAAEEKTKVADFYSKNRSYNEEIQLRQEALKDIEVLSETAVKKEQIIDNESALTPQKQNYKIANAYAAQENIEDAIPYLQKSIEEAKANNDLVVQKDATRKLGELYRAKGDVAKAETTFKDYEVIVDKLYVQKEQEISQAARFSRDLTLKQTRIESLEKDRALNESRYQLAVENQNLVSQSNNRQKWIIGVLIALAFVLLVAAYLMYRNNKQQKFANNLLALKSLRSQMNPHFIFNALNSVNSFIATNDERAANRYLSEFSGLMRSVLENSEEDFIPLSKEIELLQKYTKLEHFRFQDKFDYDIVVDDAIPTDQFKIPPMLLQPYVENAVWHGLRYKEDKGNLLVHFQLKDEHTVVTVIEDDGIGRTQSKAIKTDNQKKQKSQGMSNIQRRISILNDMYSDTIAIAITDKNEFNHTGTRVAVTLKKQ